MQIQYKEQPDFSIKSIAVVGSFNGYDASKGRMHLKEDIWVYEIELPPGEYYYKFLINGALLLNDPDAGSYRPRQEGADELWSVLHISSSGVRMYSSAESSVNIEDYQLSSVISENEGVGKHRFSSVLDKKVVARYGFNRIRGVHSVTVLWCDYTGNVREYSEQILFPEEDAEKLIFLWFWMTLKELECPDGSWKVKLLVDGQHVMEDDFQIGSGFLYSQDGKIKNF